MEADIELLRLRYSDDCRSFTTVLQMQGKKCSSCSHGFNHSIDWVYRNFTIGIHASTLLEEEVAVGLKVLKCTWIAL